MSEEPRPLLVHAHPSEGARVATAREEQAHLLGVGKVAAAVRLSRALQELRPPWVLAFGVCGAYPGAGLAVGELCLVRDESLADEGVEAPSGFLSLADLDLGDDELWMADRSLTERVRAVIGDVPIVRATTVSTCSGTDELARLRHERTAAAIETMEGAAIAAVCSAWGVPWVGLRAVGNLTGNRDRAPFGMAGAANRVQDAVLAIADAGLV